MMRPLGYLFVPLAADALRPRFGNQVAAVRRREGNEGRPLSGLSDALITSSGFSPKADMPNEQHKWGVAHDCGPPLQL